MTTLNGPEILDTHLDRIEATAAATRRNLYSLRLLDIARLTHAAVGDVCALTLDLTHRWEQPYGPTLVGIRTSTCVWGINTPPSWLANWHTADGHPFSSVVSRIERHLAAALGTDDPDELGWQERPFGSRRWEVALPAPTIVNALFSLDVLTIGDVADTGPYVYLPEFPDGPYYARRSCPACWGSGLVPVTPIGDTDTCSCVGRLPA